MSNRRFDKLSDAELVALCNSGRRHDAVDAFNSLYRRHRDYVTRVSLRLCSDREIAADVLQESFIYLLRKFPPSGDGLVLTAKLRSLLYPAARNLTLTAVRKRQRGDTFQIIRFSDNASSFGDEPVGPREEISSGRSVT